MPFAPVVDGDVLPATPWQALADGAARDVDLLVGHTRDEHRLFSLIDGVLGQVTARTGRDRSAALAPGPDGARRYREAFPAAGPMRSCTNWSTPTGCSACRRSTSPTAHARRRRPGPPLRADLARPGIGRRPRRLPRPGRAARLRQPEQWIARHADRRPALPRRRRRCPHRSAARGRRSPPTATRAGLRTTPSSGSPALRHAVRPSPPTRRRPPGCCGRATPSRRSR